MEVKLAMRLRKLTGLKLQMRRQVFQLQPLRVQRHRPQRQLRLRQALAMANVKGGNSAFRPIRWGKQTSFAANSVKVMIMRFVIFLLRWWKCFLSGYGIAEEFVDENYCTERCRKVALGKPQKAGKVGNKRKSTSSNTSHQHADSSLVVESSIDSCDSTKESDSKVIIAMFVSISVVLLSFWCSSRQQERLHRGLGRNI